MGGFVHGGIPDGILLCCWVGGGGVLGEVEVSFSSGWG